MDSNSNINADAETKLHNDEVLKNLKPGDLIKIHRDLYKHWAVYIGKEEGVEKVIHWCTGERTKFLTSLAMVILAFIEIDKFRKIADIGEAHVKIDSFWTAVGNSKAEIGNNKDLENGNIDNSQVVEKAKILKQKAKPGEQFYNSEHFANWCRYGQPPQKTSSEGLSNATDKATLNLYQTAINDKVDDKIKEHNKKFLDTLEIGDLIKFPRRFYYHWAVYIGKEDDTDNADPKVIHWWGPPDFRTSKKGASIMKTSFWDAAGNSKAEKGNESDLEKGTIDGQRVAARAAAKQSLVERKVLKENYSILFNNCEHFAKWCRYKLDDDDKVQESPRANYRWVCKKGGQRARDVVPPTSSTFRTSTREDLETDELLKILEEETRKLHNTEKKVHEKIIVGFILMFGYVTFISLSGRRFGKTREGLRLLKSKSQK